MTRWSRPAQAESLFASPEMALRSEEEIEVDRRGANEGDGVGFDNIDMSAYAERIFVPGDDWQTVRDWYRARFEALGWRATRVEDDAVMFARDEVEMAQVQLLPMQEYWSNHFGRPGPFMRVDIKVSPE